MASETGDPLELYVAAYSDPEAAQFDWNGIKAMADTNELTVEGLALVSRDADGKLHVRDNANAGIKKAGASGAAVGLVIGVIVGLLVGAISAAVLLTGAAVGGAVGAVVGGFVSHYKRTKIRAEVGEDLPAGSSGIVVLFEEARLDGIEISLPKADNISKHQVGRHDLEHAKTAATSGT